VFGEAEGPLEALLAEQPPRSCDERRCHLEAREHLAVTQQPSHLIRPYRAREVSFAATLPKLRAPVAKSSSVEATTLSRLCPSELSSAKLRKKKKANHGKKPKLRSRLTLRP